jgi:hypothetical protein
MEFNRADIMGFIKKHRHKIALAMAVAIIALSVLNNFGIIKMDAKVLNEVTFVLFALGFALIFMGGKGNNRKQDKDVQGSDGSNQDQIAGNGREKPEDNSKEQESDHKEE